MTKTSPLPPQEPTVEEPQEPTAEKKIPQEPTTKPWVLQKPCHTNWARRALLNRVPASLQGSFLLGAVALSSRFILETIWRRKWGRSTARSLEVVRSKSSQDSSGHEEGRPLSRRRYQLKGAAYESTKISIPGAAFESTKRNVEEGRPLSRRRPIELRTPADEEWKKET